MAQLTKVAGTSKSGNKYEAIKIQIGFWESDLIFDKMKIAYLERYADEHPDEFPEAE